MSRTRECGFCDGVWDDEYNDGYAEGRTTGYTDGRNEAERDIARALENALVKRERGAELPLPLYGDTMNFDEVRKMIREALA